VKNSGAKERNNQDNLEQFDRKIEGRSSSWRRDADDAIT
jgi:hypothetical protein